MKTKSLFIIAVALALGCPAGKADAAISLFEAWKNIDGTATDITADVIADIGSDGLGTISFTVGGAGSHYVSLFVDHEIDEAENTFFNEFGDSSGTPAAGQTWEIDEPGFTFGDIYDNFLAGTLDGTNGVPSTGPDDVSMALGWEFLLAPGETASVLFSLQEFAPSTGFYLTQTDPDSNKTIYLSSTNTIRGGTDVPDSGATLTMFTAGLALIGAVRRTGRRKAQS